MLGHNGLFAGPFETSKMIAKTIADLSREYAAQQEAKRAAVPGMGGAVCVINSTAWKLSFNYRWGTAEWQSVELQPGYHQWFAWKYDSGERRSPTFEIAYDEDLSSAYQERRYVLDRNASPMPATCDQAARYDFSQEGDRVVLRSTK